VVTQVPGLEALQVFVFLDAEAGPLLMNDVGQGGVLHPFLDLMILPIIGELVAGLLARQKCLRIGHVGQIHLAVLSLELQLVTICNQLRTFLFETVFQYFPIISGPVAIRLLSQRLDYINN
jgi:hypothetical protein